VALFDELNRSGSLRGCFRRLPDVPPGRLRAGRGWMGTRHGSTVENGLLRWAGRTSLGGSKGHSASSPKGEEVGVAFIVAIKKDMTVIVRKVTDR
jgi:hypothetical protein